MRAACIIFAALSFGACLSSGAPSDQPLTVDPPFTDSNRDGYWRIADPRDFGIRRELLAKHIDLCRRTGADAQIVVCDGRIISEWYSQNYRLPVYAMSSTKAVSSLLVGTLVDSGRIDSVKAKIGVFVPGWREGRRGRVTLEQVLTHSSGLLRRSEKGESVGFETDKTGFVLALEPDREPGSSYSYSNEAVQLLDAVIEGASGRRTADYAREALFGPLGMDDSALNLDAKGHAWTYADMKTTPRDLARIGQLVLDRGRWKGVSVVSEAYIDAALKPSPAYREMGYLWWILYADGRIIGYYASGYLNTDIYVLPSNNIVIVRTQAPKRGYTGAQESEGYFEKARKLFLELSRP